ncbi:MAG: helix-turn-helix domain-containing protein, partial [Halobacteria archaeon]|nr:helix-turn-helix domain-containing protein [Halobacteria archaeon]
MPQAKIRLKTPEEAWIHEISTKYPEAVFRVLAVLLDRGKGTVLLRLEHDDPKQIMSEMGTHEQITEIHLLREAEEEALLQFETNNPRIVFAAHESGVPLETPFIIQDGEIEWKITTSHEHLLELSEKLGDFGIDFEIEYVRQIDDERLLTDRQREIILTAVKRGYYDVPRKCSLTDIAEEVGVAKSTCSEILHRAESSIIKQFVGD